MTRAALPGALLLAALLLAGCSDYKDYWEEYDKDHPRCRTSPSNAITGTQDTVCPAPGS